MRMWFAVFLAVATTATLAAETAHARNSTRNPDRWDFKVRNHPVAMARATTMWQVKEAERARKEEQARRAAANSPVFIADTLESGELSAASTLQSSPYGARGGYGTLLPNATSVGNMNIVTVTVYEGGTADVAVEAEQENLGKIESDSNAISGETAEANFSY